MDNYELDRVFLDACAEKKELRKKMDHWFRQEKIERWLRDEQVLSVPADSPAQPVPLVRPVLEAGNPLVRENAPVAPPVKPAWWQRRK